VLESGREAANGCKRPFEANNHDQLAQKIRNASVPFPLTNPPVSNPCIHAIGCLIERDRKYRIGAASFESFTDCPFFRTIDFVQLEAKKLDPIFIPSSEKTNFDATYDLEELLLEEAPLEARARRQRPRDQLKDDATKAEIRADELHRMIERLFEPFDYTLANYDKGPRSDRTESPSDSGPLPTDWPMNQAITPTTSGSRMAPHSSSQAGIAVPAKPAVENFSLPRPATTGSGGSGGKYAAAQASDENRSANDSPNGSPPLPVLDLPGKTAPRSVPKDYFPDYGTAEHGQGTSRTRSTSRGAAARSRSNNNSRNSPPKGAKPWVVEENQQGRPEADALLRAADDKRPSGMLAFLSRKKGRDRSPKAKERGVLGKEGARQVVQP
jgi:serine/threonine kinase 32